MSGIQRWTPELVRYFNKVGPCLAKHEIGSYVLWTDHVAAMQAARPQPTPAELIPKLKEHEWVRGTYKTTGIAFGPCTVYYNEIGAMFAGDNQLIHWNDGTITDELATIERCDAPVVVK